MDKLNRIQSRDLTTILLEATRLLQVSPRDEASGAAEAHAHAREMWAARDRALFAAAR